ncbi:suppressor of fused domain protein [Fulvivirga ligni]|uniref:suppressor of fused domain protein n=1 Tax=Fulvivirga ligni TaxID=2904246 RepID=UPI001F409776|nr:suppressor of fused domain protein [Fulvivirga ligni]UII19566.1 suppressor of fused domain protein [Fulvivirga ligni]
MRLFRKRNYTEALRRHYKNYFGSSGNVRRWKKGPQDKLHPDFYVLEIAPNRVHNMWAYLTVGMSVDREDHNLIELVVYSPTQNESLVELLTLNASFHRNADALNLHHSVNIGQPCIHGSNCDHGFISLPYLDGEALEIFEFAGKRFHCYWFIPITERERDFKMEEGVEALEDLFEKRQFDYLNLHRPCLLQE